MRVLSVMVTFLSVVNSQKNISPNGNARQSSDFSDRGMYFTADLAITGGPTNDFSSNSCSTTSEGQYVAWWMLTFPADTVYITSVNIYYREDTLSRFAGYYVYISNSSTIKNDGYLCYHHTGPTLPSKTENVNCNHLGKYVIIYNERNTTNNPPGYSPTALLELCDVQVIGCYKGWWGSDCSNPCPAACIDIHCYPGNGSCVWGCNPDNCLNDICDTATGKCTDGCQIGLHGDYCDKACESGTFGQNCSDTCHCINQTCDPMTGKCPPGGCERGYARSNCSTECSPGKYWYNCNQSCDGCLYDSCDTLYGNCTDKTGCKPGWQYIPSEEQKCDIACESGTFGENCSDTCHCINQTCEPITGICPSGGCKRGYTRSNCSTECSLGKYWYTCSQSCDGCLSDSCDKEYGACTNKYGCKPGWQYISSDQQKCDIECDGGYFGVNCAHQCYCRNESACIKATGKCPTTECQRGWKGDTCSEKCSDGYHGFDCIDHCDTCKSNLCERFDGNCTCGCTEGYTGHQCLVLVTPKSDGQATNDNASTKNITYAVIGTFIVTTVVCVFIFLAILRYILGKTDRNGKEQNTRDYVNTTFTTFTSEYANTGNKSTEAHYAETIPATQEHAL